MNIFLLFLISVVFSADDYEKFGCDECISKNGRYCLFDGDFNTGSCCNPKNRISNNCKYQHLNRYCATNAFTNTVVQRFVCPIKLDKCPNSKSFYIINIDKLKEYDR